MTLTSEVISQKAPEVEVSRVSLLSPEQGSLAGLLFGLVPEIDNLITDLRTYGFNEHTPLNRCDLKPRCNGLQFDVSSTARNHSVIEWQRQARQHVPGSGGDTRPNENFPVSMKEWHPSLRPPRTQLIIPNVTEQTLSATSVEVSPDVVPEVVSKLPYELTMAAVMRIKPLQESPALLILGGASEGASYDLVSPFTSSDDIAPETIARQVGRYEVALRHYVGQLAALGSILHVISAEPLAERFLK